MKELLAAVKAFEKKGLVFSAVDTSWETESYVTCSRLFRVFAHVKDENKRGFIDCSLVIRKNGGDITLVLMNDDRELCVSDFYSEHPGYGNGYSLVSQRNCYYAFTERGIVFVCEDDCPENGVYVY